MKRPPLRLGFDAPCAAFAWRGGHGRSGLLVFGLLLISPSPSPPAGEGVGAESQAIILEFLRGPPGHAQKLSARRKGSSLLGLFSRPGPCMKRRRLHEARAVPLWQGGRHVGGQCAPRLAVGVDERWLGRHLQICFVDENQ